MNRFPALGFTGLMILVMTFITACGGGGASGGGGPVAGIGGSGRVSSGSISGFGSIFVNGVEYQTGSASISVDDASGTENDLRLGMVVTVTGSVSGATGTATDVTYDANVEGPVTPVSGQFPGPDLLTKTFTVLGTTVVADTTGTVFDNSAVFNFNTLALNDVVEVSGFFDSSGVLHASFIRKTGTFDPLNPPATTVEIKGTANVAGAGAGPGGSFTITTTTGTVTVNILAATDLSGVPGALVTNGMFVEVKGPLLDATTIDATRIEQESTSIGDVDDDVSIEGLVSGFNGLADFQVAGQRVDASAPGVSFDPPSLATTLANDDKIEVEGTIDSSGVLIADKLEARGDDIKVHATVNLISVTNAATNTGSITLNVAGGGSTITVLTDSVTTFEDKTGADPTPPLKLDEISTGDFVEISGYLDAAGKVVATEVRRDSPDDVIVQAPVQSFVNLSSITLLGVTFTTDGSTQFEDTDDNPLPGGAADFYGSLSQGDLVKIKDNGTLGDGTADEVDRES